MNLVGFQYNNYYFCVELVFRTMKAPPSDKFILNQTFRSAWPWHSA